MKINDNVIIISNLPDFVFEIVRCVVCNTYVFKHDIYCPKCNFHLENSKRLFGGRM
jgi:hypothetical protein